MLVGRFYLHGNPATALAWKEGIIEALASDPLAHVVTADQCQQRYVQFWDALPELGVPAFRVVVPHVSHVRLGDVETAGVGG